MTLDAAIMPMQSPFPIKLTGLELGHALAEHFRYAPESVDQIHITYLHAENSIGFVLEDADLIDIDFKPYVSDTLAKKETKDECSG